MFLGLQPSRLTLNQLISRKFPSAMSLGTLDLDLGVVDFDEGEIREQPRDPGKR